MPYDDEYIAISAFPTEYDAGVCGEYASLIKSNRSLLKFIFLSIITCGLYSLSFFYKCGRDINFIAMNDGHKTSNFTGVFLLSLAMFCVFGAYPVNYYISNGGEISFISDPVYAKMLEFAVMLVIFVLAFVPILVWFHNFSLRVDNELQKRKTDYRLPLAVYWIFVCVLPIVFDIAVILMFLVRDSIEIKWVIYAIYSFCGVGIAVSVLIYLSFVIFSMNVLSQCAIYKNVEYH